MLCMAGMAWQLKELNQWPLFLVTFRLDYASFLTEMEVDVKARSKATAATQEHQRAGFARDQLIQFPQRALLYFFTICKTIVIVGEYIFKITFSF